jgi:IS5 family transposase
MHCEPPAITFIPCEEHFRPVLPTIEGNVDYLTLRGQLTTMDELLRTSGIENEFVTRSLNHWVKTLSQSKVEEIALSVEGKGGVIRLEELVRGQQQVRFQEHSIRAFRCTIARTLLGGSFRDFAARLADSPLLQWFCQVGQLDRVKVPAKSTLQRYATWLPEEEMRQVINGLLRKAGAAIADGKQVLDLEAPLDLSRMFLDTTCVKANIHFPVDWVLLRDGVKSLMQSVELIRLHGLKSRMCEPQEFITKINRLSMEMTHTRRKKNGKKERKRVLREMKRIVTVVRAHAQRYRALLDENWQATDWTRRQAEQVLKRIDSVLGALPAAVKQAHERIIGERQVANDEKLLSLFEPHIHVIVRGKAGEEVEFGNLLVLGEQIDGLIMDWELFKEEVPADMRLVRPSVERAESALEVGIKSLVTDRGFDNKANVKWLEGRGTFSGLCPRDPRALREAMKDQRFAQAQHRRAQTEARVAIFKNEFLGRPMRAEGFENRALQVAWGVLTHNLWVLANKLREQRKIREQQVRKAA